MLCRVPLPGRSLGLRTFAQARFGKIASVTRETYGDDTVIGHRVRQVREQGEELQALADRLVAQLDQLQWSGRAADDLRSRVRDRASHLRACAQGHELAGDALEKHRVAVADARDAIAAAELRAATLLADDDPRITHLALPPSGHRDWLDLDLPGA